MIGRIKLYAIANNEDTDGLTKGKQYEVESIFRTDHCGFGYAVIVSNDKKNLLAYDITHFEINFNESINKPLPFD